MSRRNVLFAAIVSLGAHPALAEEAHVHGSAALNIVIEGETVEAELTLPAADAVGFERSPRTDDERAQVASAIERLGDGLAMVGLPKDAACTLAETRLIEGLLSHPTSADHDHPEDRHADEEDRSAEKAHHDDTEHKDFVMRWRFACRSPDALTSLSPGVFAAFRALRMLRVRAITPSGQTAVDLTPDNAAATF